MKDDVGMRLSIGALLVAALAVPIPAQQPDELYVETIEVNVVSVDVFATDSKGAPVIGLTKDDFEIFESGARQEITTLRHTKEVTTAASSGSDGVSNVSLRRTRLS